MEATWRWSAITAVAPITWGATYYVTSHALPAHNPLWGAVLRAVPAGLLLLAWRRRLPEGSWWWRAAALGTLNTGAFFALVYVAAQLLPTSVAATVMATSPVAMLLLAWPLLGRRPAVVPLLGALAGVLGVALLVGAGGAAPDARGVAASLAALLMSSLGYVLAARWSRAPGARVPDVLSSTSWQLLAGGLALIPVALAVEGTPPALDGAAVAGFGFVALIATALAFSCWFAGLARLDPGTVGLLGLLNPLTGVALGTALGGERLEAWQALGALLVLTGVLAGQPSRSMPGARDEENAGVGTGVRPRCRRGGLGRSWVLSRPTSRKEPSCSAPPASPPPPSPWPPLRRPPPSARPSSTSRGR